MICPFCKSERTESKGIRKTFHDGKDHLSQKRICLSCGKYFNYNLYTCEIWFKD